VDFYDGIDCDSPSLFKSVGAVDKTTRHLKAISISVTRDDCYHVTTQEPHGANPVSQIKAQLKQLGIDRLASYHLDITGASLFANSGSRDSRHWSGLERRIASGSFIPTKELSLDFRRCRLSGKVQNFLVSGWLLCLQRETITDMSVTIGLASSHRQGLGQRHRCHKIQTLHGRFHGQAKPQEQIQGGRRR
jgi:hypothetical protein